MNRLEFTGTKSDFASAFSFVERNRETTLPLLALQFEMRVDQSFETEEYLKRFSNNLVLHYSVLNNLVL